MASSTSRPDVVALVVRDHRTVDELFQQFDLYDDTVADNLKRDLVLQISRALSTHAAAEEQVVYPVVRAEVPGGEALADEALADHRKMKETLARLERTDPSDPGLVVGVKALAADVRLHVDAEEKSLLPTLEARLGTTRLAELGEAFAAAQVLAPTHPTPARPPPRR